MTKKSNTSKVKQYRWVIWVGLVAVVIMLTAAYSDALSTRSKLLRELDAFEPALDVARATQEVLEERLVYVQKDAYVHQWAREEAKMTLPGETLVVITSAATPTPEPQAPAMVEATVEVEEDTSTFTRLWRALTGQD